MEVDRADGRTPNQLRPLACSRGILNRAHGSANWSQGIHISSKYETSIHVCNKTNSLLCVSVYLFFLALP